MGRTGASVRASTQVKGEPDGGAGSPLNPLRADPLRHVLATAGSRPAPSGRRV